MLEGSLAWEQGTCVLRRILHDPIHPSAHLELAHCQYQKKSSSCTRLLCTGWALDEKCLWFLSVWSNIVELIGIRQYLSSLRLPACWGCDFSVTATSGSQKSEFLSWGECIWHPLLHPWQSSGSKAIMRAKDGKSCPVGYGIVCYHCTSFILMLKGLGP